MDKIEPLGRKQMSSVYPKKRRKKIKGKIQILKSVQELLRIGHFCNSLPMSEWTRSTFSEETNVIHLPNKRLKIREQNTYSLVLVFPFELRCPAIPFPSVNLVTTESQTLSITHSVTQSSTAAGASGCNTSPLNRSSLTVIAT